MAYQIRPDPEGERFELQPQHEYLPLLIAAAERGLTLRQTIDLLARAYAELEVATRRWAETHVPPMRHIAPAATQVPADDVLVRHEDLPEGRASFLCAIGSHRWSRYVEYNNARVRRYRCGRAGCHASRVEDLLKDGAQ